MPSQLKIGEVDLLSDYSKEDLDQELGDIELVLNGEHSSAELAILISKYVKN